MNRRLFAAAIMALAGFASLPATAQTPSPSGAGITVPVTGKIGNKPSSGTFTIKKFQQVGNTVKAVGLLVLSDGKSSLVSNASVPLDLAASGTGDAAAKAAARSSSISVGPQIGVAATCDILHLTLGPLDLDLLGLQVHLDRVVLDITAESGSGNLLGNLLCAVVNLLNNPLQDLTNLITALNDLLTALGNL
jgi:hypothetical protein